MISRLKNSFTAQIVLLIVVTVGLGLGGDYAYRELLNGGVNPKIISAQLVTLAKQHIDETQSELLNGLTAEKPQNLTPPNILMFACKRYAGTTYMAGDVQLKVKEATIDKIGRSSAEVTETVEWLHCGLTHTITNKLIGRVENAKWVIEPIDYISSVGF